MGPGHNSYRRPRGRFRAAHRAGTWEKLLRKSSQRIHATFHVCVDIAVFVLGMSALALVVWFTLHHDWHALPDLLHDEPRVAPPSRERLPQQRDPAEQEAVDKPRFVMISLPPP
jgi:hypothetical protein